MKDNLQRLKIKYIIFITIFFTVLYKGAEFYTRTLDYVPSYFMAWEKKIPFLTIFMLPYMTSAPFFFGTFLTIKDEKKLNFYVKQAIFLTVVSIAIFFIVPMKFYFPKPEIANPIFNFLFYLLGQLDSSFNQCPSLHVSFAFLSIAIYCKEMKTKLKYLIAIWGFLIAISVHFVYQHHFIDFVGGFIMFLITWYIFPKFIKSVKK